MKNFSRFLLLSLFAYVLLYAGFSFAANVDTTNKWAWGSNIGWINFNPTLGDVTVTNTKMTGNAWSGTQGWIDLDPTNGGVTNTVEGLNGSGTCQGNLSGYAWNTNMGWVDFDGVSIDANGYFGGTASGALSGTISMSGSTYVVQTTWKPDCIAPTTPTCISSPSPANNGTNITTTCSGVEIGTIVTIPGMTCTPSPETSSTVTCSGTVGTGTGQISQSNGQVTVTDSTGNTNTTETTGIVIDNTASSISITTSVAPYIEGNGAPGDTIEIVTENGTTCTTTVNELGYWICTIPGGESTAGETFTATTTDGSGNTASTTGTLTQSTRGGGGGSGGSSVTRKDYCPNGDNSGDSYDRTCHAPEGEEEEEKTLESASEENTDEETTEEETTPEDNEDNNDEKEENTQEQEETNIPTPESQAKIQKEITLGENTVEYQLKEDYSSCPIITDINDMDYDYPRDGVFPDIENSPYADIIRKFAKIGVVNGTEEGNFEPTRAISRTEFVKIVLISHCYYYKDQDASDLKYQDVDKASWQAKVIKKAQTLGIINGDVDEFGNPVFRPNDFISKAEAVKILMRMAFITVNDPDPTTYTDIEVSWHIPYVETGENLGVFDSEEDRRIFSPNGSVQREEMINLLYKTVLLYR